MPNYLQYKKMMAVLDEDSDIESWITVKGNHIPIRKGQTKEEAVKSFIDRKKNVANEIVNRVHGHAVGGWIGSQKEYKDLFYRNENGKTKSNEEMHKFADRVETEVRMARKTPQFKKSVMSAHSIAMGDLQKEMPESMKKTFTPERHKELMEKKFKDKDEDVIFGNWNYSDQYHNEFFNDEGNWLDDEAEKRYEYMKKVENKFDEIYETRSREAMQHAANKIVKQEPDLYEHNKSDTNKIKLKDKDGNEHLVDIASIKEDPDTLPSVGRYKEYLNKITRLTGMTIESARQKYGSYTEGQWQDLFAAKENGLIPQENAAEKEPAKPKNTYLSNPNTLKEFANYFGITESVAKKASEKFGDSFYHVMIKDPKAGAGLAMNADDYEQADVDKWLENNKTEKKTTKAPKVKYVDAKKWNDPRSDPWYALYE